MARVAHEAMGLYIDIDGVTDSTGKGAFPALSGCAAFTKAGDRKAHRQTVCTFTVFQSNIGGTAPRIETPHLGTDYVKLVRVQRHDDFPSTQYNSAEHSSVL